MKRIALALALVLGCALGVREPSAGAEAGVPVLMYHKVDPNTPHDRVGRALTLDPAAFEAQLRYLRAHHIATLTLDGLVGAIAAGHRPRRAVVLTFDDGYADAATYVTPLLLKYGARASFYVSAGFIGDGRHLDWRQLRGMRRAGMEIGCHGTFHLDLSRLSRAEATHEIAHCATTLARYLGRPTTYAYAAGKWGPATHELLAASGFKAAVTERPGTVASLTAPYELPRLRVDRDDGPAVFAALVDR